MGIVHWWMRVDFKSYFYFIFLGLWIFKKWKQIVSLQQLSLDESKKTEETYLYQLSITEVYLFF